MSFSTYSQLRPKKWLYGSVKFIHTKLKANQFVSSKIMTKNYIFWYKTKQRWLKHRYQIKLYSIPQNHRRKTIFTTTALSNKYFSTKRIRYFGGDIETKFKNDIKWFHENWMFISDRNHINRRKLQNYNLFNLLGALKTFGGILLQDNFAI